MSALGIAAIAVGAGLCLYLAFLLTLALLERREEARALAGFVPDCVVLFGRMLRDPGVSSGQRVPLGGLVAYLALPFDLVPDFIPVADQLDDAILVAPALRLVLRRNEARVVANWPGPRRSLEVLLRLADSKRLDQSDESGGVRPLRSGDDRKG